MYGLAEVIDTNALEQQAVQSLENLGLAVTSNNLKKLWHEFLDEELDRVLFICAERIAEEAKFGRARLP